MVDSCIVSIDFTHGKDKAVLIVGKKRMNESVKIVNAFEGEKAIEMYEKVLDNLKIDKTDI